MRTILLLLAGLFGVGLLTYWCGTENGPHFAMDLSLKTSAALNAAGIDPVDVSGEGQIITLRGKVASEEIKSRAGDEARKVWGVEEVRNELMVAAPQAPVMTVKERKEATGCQTEFDKLLAGEKIQFETSSSTISPRSDFLINRLAVVAGKCPSAKVKIEGHTDSRGSHSMNIALSQLRAAAVERVLESKGVARDRITSEGFGPDKPIANNSTAAGMEKNRRTEFHVQGIE
jgi:outer membrane protein OmpA-like peptidoglycan-associated protein